MDPITMQVTSKPCDLSSFQNFLVVQDELKVVITENVESGIYLRKNYKRPENKIVDNVCFSPIENNGRILSVDKFYECYEEENKRINNEYRIPNDEIKTHLTAGNINTSSIFKMKPKRLVNGRKYPLQFSREFNNLELDSLKKEIERSEENHTYHTVPHKEILQRKIKKKPDVFQTNEINNKYKHIAKNKLQETSTRRTRMSSKNKFNFSKTSKKQSDARESVSTARTRSGRISRPPKHLKDCFNLFSEEGKDLRDNEFAAETDFIFYKNNNSKNTILQKIKKEYYKENRCNTCNKVFSGEGHMLRHMKAYPDHFKESILYQAANELSLYSLFSLKMKQTAETSEDPVPIYLNQLKDFLEEVSIKTVFNNSLNTYELTSSVAKIFGIPEGYYGINIDKIMVFNDNLQNCNLEKQESSINYNLNMSNESTVYKLDNEELQIMNKTEEISHSVPDAP